MVALIGTYTYWQCKKIYFRAKSVLSLENVQKGWDREMEHSSVSNESER